MNSAQRRILVVTLFTSAAACAALVVLMIGTGYADETLPVLGVGAASLLVGLYFLIQIFFE